MIGQDPRAIGSSIHPSLVTIHLPPKWRRGGKGIRTPDIQLAKLALYQLSYAPVTELRTLDWGSGIANPGWVGVSPAGFAAYQGKTFLVHMKSGLKPDDTQPCVAFNTAAGLVRSGYKFPS